MRTDCGLLQGLDILPRRIRSRHQMHATVLKYNDLSINFNCKYQPPLTEIVGWLGIIGTGLLAHTVILLTRTS